jgi:hypothetical protein
VPVEELLPPDACPQPAAQPDPMRGLDRRSVERRLRDRGNAPPKPKQEPRQEPGPTASPAPDSASEPQAQGASPDGTPRKKRRRRRRGKGGGPADTI